MRKRKKRTKNLYFTKIHEEAIIQYAKSEDNAEKTILYSTLIQPAFNELVDKIVYTYKFNNLPNIDYLKDDCKVWLTTILSKYDPNRGSKAFSYFSVITKNWFIHKIKKNAQAARREIALDDVVKSSQSQFVMTHNPYEKDREKQEFWEALTFFVRALENNSTIIKNENDKKVISSIEYMLENLEKLEILNKKAIYLYLREMTGLTTKQLAPTLRKVKVEYRQFISNWNN
jgi:hypothetical protein|tara:strand:- start:1390 stop:2079 length:690 start_codon:yes stop_codon:yes gene_type:complete